MFTVDGDCNTAAYTLDAASIFTYDVSYTKRNLANGVRSAFSAPSTVSFPEEIPLRGLLNATMIPGGGELYEIYENR